VRSFTDVHDALTERGVEHEIIHLSSSSKTAQSAAEALGVPLACVVKSLVFLADGRPVLALVDGEARVDGEALARVVGVKGVVLARGATVRDLTGYEPGGVSPVALATDLPLIADPAVFEPDVVYCGGGTTTAMLRIRAEDLRRLLGARVASIGLRT
jgi:Cys-tRNA(Pro) deacylase